LTPSKSEEAFSPSGGVAIVRANSRPLGTLSTLSLAPREALQHRRVSLQFSSVYLTGRLMLESRNSAKKSKGENDAPDNTMRARSLISGEPLVRHETARSARLAAGSRGFYQPLAHPICTPRLAPFFSRGAGRPRGHLRFAGTARGALSEEEAGRAPESSPGTRVQCGQSGVRFAGYFVSTAALAPRPPRKSCQCPGLDGVSVRSERSVA